MFDKSLVASEAMSSKLLDAETEQQLVRAWRDHGDQVALHRLVTAYMRLAVKIANQYRRYGVPVNDLIQEASIGLMKAAQKFDPDREVRFSTYAVWWIKAAIQDYVMRNWSLVRTGSTSAQKTLFFNFKRVRNRLLLEHGPELSSNEMRRLIAEELGCPLRDVIMMEGRLAGSDFSLNAPQAGEEGREWVETLEDSGSRAEDEVARNHDLLTLRQWLTKAMGELTERERMIIIARKLTDEPETLESLGVKLNLSKERVRQLEAIALKKLKKQLEKRYGSVVADLAKGV